MLAVRRRGRIAASATTHPATTRSDAIVAVIVMIGSIPTILIQATVLESSNTIPCASCRAPSTDSAAGRGAALLRPYRYGCSVAALLLAPRPRHRLRCRYGRSVAALLLAPRPATDSAAGTGAALLRPYRYVQRATFNLQLLAPRATAMAPAASPGAAALRPSTLSSHVQRATFNLQLLAPHPLVPLASRPSRLAPSLPITPPSGHSCTHRCACQRTVICVVYYRARFVPASFPGLWQSMLSACTRRTGVRPLQFDWSTVWT
jgi:hypothetical protein